MFEGVWKDLYDFFVWIKHIIDEFVSLFFKLVDSPKLSNLLRISTINLWPTSIKAKNRLLENWSRRRERKDGAAPVHHVILQFTKRLDYQLRSVIIIVEQIDHRCLNERTKIESFNII